MTFWYVIKINFETLKLIRLYVLKHIFRQT